MLETMLGQQLNRCPNDHRRLNRCPNELEMLLGKRLNRLLIQDSPLNGPPNRDRQSQGRLKRAGQVADVSVPAAVAG